MIKYQIPPDLQKSGLKWLQAVQRDFSFASEAEFMVAIQAAYCLTDIEESQVEMASHGRTITTERGGLAPSPYVRIVQNSRAQFIQCCQKLKLYGRAPDVSDPAAAQAEADRRRLYGDDEDYS